MAPEKAVTECQLQRLNEHGNNCYVNLTNSMASNDGVTSKFESSEDQPSVVEGSNSTTSDFGSSEDSATFLESKHLHAFFLVLGRLWLWGDLDVNLVRDKIRIWSRCEKLQRNCTSGDSILCLFGSLSELQGQQGYQGEGLLVFEDIGFDVGR
ncbi:hypothetical protein NE237_019009 [Protea cynaroides]|uniref:Uncharacterized protein n=1 Tax=Protea cynaroides TaxID=273540 RepID=A0A9Q0KB22_9MAGN|nr:hypothetical protein NE237_019009 [Protea cynaroides]